MELALWQSGFIERMVRSTKRCLRKILEKANVTYNELQTILKEIECIINNRPLTFIYDDDLEYSLTPNHLIYGRNLNNVASFTHDTNFEELNETNIEGQLKYVRQIVTHFWKRWRNEYIIELREHFKKEKPAALANINVNDVVLIMDEKLPRIKWRTGRIIKLIKGKDNAVRGTEILTLTDNQNRSILRRAINRLIPLELYDNKLNESDNDVLELLFVDDKDIEMI